MSLVGRPQPETTSLTKNCAEQPYVSFKTLSIKQPAVWLKVFFQLKVFFGLDGFVYTLYMPTCLLQGKRTCLHSVHGATRALGRHCDEWSQNVTKPCFLRSQKCNVGYFLQCYIKKSENRGQGPFKSHVVLQAGLSRKSRKRSDERLDLAFLLLIIQLAGHVRQLLLPGTCLPVQCMHIRSGPSE